MFPKYFEFLQWPAGSAAAGLGPKFVASVKIPRRPPSVPYTAAPRPERGWFATTLCKENILTENGNRYILSKLWYVALVRSKITFSI